MHKDAFRLRGSVIALTLALLSCGSPVQPTGPANHAPKMTIEPQEGVSALGDGDAAAQPPVAVSPPRIEATMTVERTGGPQLCAANRPDLQRSFFEVQLEEPLAPEEQLLLEYWVKESLARKFESVIWAATPCAKSFVCASLPANKTFAFAQALANTLSDPPLATFYPARTAALEQARQLSTLPWWRVHTAMSTLMHPSPSVERAINTRIAAESDSPQADRELERILEQHSVTARLPLLSPSGMKEELTRVLPSTRVILAGPTSPALTLKAFETGLQTPPRPPNPGSSTVEDAGELDFPEVVRLTEDADNWSYASTAWDPSAITDREATLVGLSILIRRIQGLTPPGVIVEWPRVLHQENLLNLDLRGPHEQVLETLQVVQEQASKIISAAGAPSLSEIKSARLALTVRAQQGLEPRCTPTLKPTFTSRNITDALRGLGPSRTLIWGRVAEEQSNDSPP